jgi:hypothetical protein
VVSLEVLVEAVDGAAVLAAQEHAFAPGQARKREGWLGKAYEADCRRMQRAGAGVAERKVGHARMPPTRVRMLPRANSRRFMVFSKARNVTGQ